MSTPEQPTPQGQPPAAPEAAPAPELPQQMPAPTTVPAPDEPPGEASPATPPAGPGSTAAEIRAAGLGVDVPWEGPSLRPPPLRYGNVAKAQPQAPPEGGAPPASAGDGVAAPPPRAGALPPTANSVRLAALPEVGRGVTTHGSAPPGAAGRGTA